MPRSGNDKRFDDLDEIAKLFVPEQGKEFKSETNDKLCRNNNGSQDPSSQRSNQKHQVIYDQSSNSSSSECIEVEDDDEIALTTEDESRPSGVVDLIVTNMSKFADWPRDKKEISEPVIIRCLPWRILVMLRMSEGGNQQSYPKYRSQQQPALGFFIQCNAENSSNSWSCHADAHLCIMPQKEGCKPFRKSISHTFYAKENDWGFVNFLLLKEVLNPESGYVKNDSIHLRVCVKADAPHGSQWNSKKFTGFVGIKNQGATCYMNSLLQALYFTNKLRKAVYQIPTDPDDRLEIPLCLQWLFYDLQHSQDFVDTKRLTRSFGWESSDSFMQHDVQELCRVLLENLEKKMKGTIVSDTIPGLFCGRMLSYVRCKHVALVSEREENFYDIQLKVKDNRSIYDAFKDYIAVETLTGDNLYNAGELGMQEAEKGVLFLRYPPVLYLQLMRFQYDPETDANVKINDRFEFPYTMNLDPFLKEKGSDPATFFLHAVLVHSGDQHGGHYIVYINPRGDNKWFKFDDDVVSSCSSKEAIEGNYGGHSLDSELGARKYCSNAYMLVYIRESAKTDVLAPIVDEDIPQWMRDKFSVKQKDVDDVVKEIQIHLILEDDFLHYQGHFLCDCAPTRTISYPQNSSYYDFLCLLANKLNLDVHLIRPWTFKPKVTYQNRCYLQHLSESRYSTGRFKEIWLEILTAPSFQMGAPPDPDDCLCFVKSYDTAREELTYMGHVLVPLKAQLSTSVEHFKQKILSHQKEVDFQFYLESDIDLDAQYVKDPNHSLEDCLCSCNLPSKEDGHVLVLQFFPSDCSAVSPSTLVQKISTFYRLCNKKTRVLFLDRRKLLDSVKKSSPSMHRTTESSETLDEDDAINTGNLAQHPLLTADTMSWDDVNHYGGFISTLPLDMTYWQIVDAVVERLHEYSLIISREHVQLFLASQSMDSAIPSTNRSPLQELLAPNWVNNLSVGHTFTITSANDTSGILRGQTLAYRLFYQILNMSIEKVEAMQHIRLRYVPPNLQEELDISVYLEPQATAARLMDTVSKHPAVVNGEVERSQLRLWETSQCRLLCLVSQEDRKVDEIMASLQRRGNSRYLRVDHRPLDERKSNTQFMKVAHYCKDPLNNMHGIPFTVMIDPDDTFKTVAERIRQKLDVPAKEFAKWQISIIHNHQVHSLAPDEKPVALLQSYLENNILEDSVPIWIGLDHRVTPKRSVEKAIVIHN